MVPEAYTPSTSPSMGITAGNEIGKVEIKE